MNGIMKGFGVELEGPLWSRQAGPNGVLVSSEVGTCFDISFLNEKCFSSGIWSLSLRASLVQDSNLDASFYK